MCGVNGKLPFEIQRHDLPQTTAADWTSDISRQSSGEAYMTIRPSRTIRETMRERPAERQMSLKPARHRTMKSKHMK
jgi:hypothetical protein